MAGAFGDGTTTVLRIDSSSNPPTTSPSAKLSSSSRVQTTGRGGECLRFSVPIGLSTLVASVALRSAPSASIRRRLAKTPHAAGIGSHSGQYT